MPPKASSILARATSFYSWTEERPVSNPGSNSKRKARGSCYPQSSLNLIGRLEPQKMALWYASLQRTFKYGFSTSRRTNFLKSSPSIIKVPMNRLLIKRLLKDVAAIPSRSTSVTRGSGSWCTQSPSTPIASYSCGPSCRTTRNPPPLPWVPPPRSSSATSDLTVWTTILLKVQPLCQDLVLNRGVDPVWGPYSPWTGGPPKITTGSPLPRRAQLRYHRWVLDQMQLARRRPPRRPSCREPGQMSPWNTKFRKARLWDAPTT